MSAMIRQIQDLLSEHGAAFSYGMETGCRCMGCHVYVIAVDDRTFEADTLSGVVGDAWSYVCTKGDDDER